MPVVTATSSRGGMAGSKARDRRACQRHRLHLGEINRIGRIPEPRQRRSGQDGSIRLRLTKAAAATRQAAGMPDTMTRLAGSVASNAAIAAGCGNLHRPADPAIDEQIARNDAEHEFEDHRIEEERVIAKRRVNARKSSDDRECGKNHDDVAPDIAGQRHQQRDGEIEIHLIFERPADIDDRHLAVGKGDERQRLEDMTRGVPVRRAEGGGNGHREDRDGKDHQEIQRHDALDPAAQELRRCQLRGMGRIENDKSRNDEKKIDATATVRQQEGDGALGNLEAIRCDACGMKGNNSSSGQKPENLDVNEHPVSLACGGLQLNNNRDYSIICRLAAAIGR